MKAALAAALALAFPALAHADAARGERAFQRCYSCHSVAASETNLQGPNLNGVVGRRAGALAGFEYSPALRQAGARGLIWTRAALDRFIADPETVIPGVRMGPAPGLNDPALRADVIDFLEQAGR
jgi:cytochrome c